MLETTLNLFAGLFQQYDHGSDLNWKYYGNPEPPSYNLTAVTVPVSLHVGDADTLVPYEVCQSSLTSVWSLNHDTSNISTGSLSHWTSFATVEPSQSKRKLTLSITENRLDSQIPLISAYISLLIIDDSERQLIFLYFPRCRIQGKTV